MTRTLRPLDPRRTVERSVARARAGLAAHPELPYQIGRAFGHGALVALSGALLYFLGVFGTWWNF